MCQASRSGKARPINSVTVSGLSRRDRVADYRQPIEPEPMTTDQATAAFADER